MKMIPYISQFDAQSGFDALSIHNNFVLQPPEGGPVLLCPLAHWKNSKTTIGNLNKYIKCTCIYNFKMPHVEYMNYVYTAAVKRSMDLSLTQRFMLPFLVTDGKRGQRGPVMHCWELMFLV